MIAKVFIDSGAFIAFFDSSDHQHREVVALFSRPPAHLVTSVLVVSETYSWFLHKLGEPSARNFRQFLEELPRLEVLGADDAHRQAVWRKLDALRGRRLTFVDASSLACLEQHGIRTVWGCDLDLAFEGATVSPGPPT